MPKHKKSGSPLLDYRCYKYMLFIVDLEQIAVPKHFEKIEDIHNLDLSDTARDSVARDDYASAIRKLIAIFFEVTHVLALHLIGWFYFDTYFRVSYYGIHFFAVVSMPITQLLVVMGISDIRHKLLNNEMLEDKS